MEDSSAQGVLRWQAKKAEVYQVLQADDTEQDYCARAHLAQEPLEDDNPYTRVQGDSFLAPDSDDDSLEVYHTPHDTYFMDMATGRYMDQAMDRGLGQGEDYSSPSPDSLTGGHLHALTAGPNQEPAQAQEALRDQYGYTQSEHEE